MSEQTHGSSRRDDEPEDVTPARAQQQSGDVDDLLDEIDSVLESNAEEFVRSFVQKGGQ
ncbi:ubiquitin-like protein Pup [Auraticoccus sp. F435]|uniref:Prokaryotic ubiquitin-like protein Pup n=1 Tax=Auraticoccus cholistanensis TaxID=2656650 RepID=A0A6A9UW96_9ACTN|nr:ubiquitin-like protein Pup [Auraticoccus cholistanensis]MVA75892.1 ubiquitin-like protein Pup [Auraticoccus cholistanensis]